MKHDGALDLLLDLLCCEREPCLWVADEHVAGHQKIPANPTAEVISNRFDVADALSKQGWNSRFSDLDFSHLNDASLTAIYFRLAKEKSLVNYVINQASKLLKPNGRLIISGQKQQGIKTYAKKAGQCLAGKVDLKKHGNHYLSIISRGQHAGQWLDDQNYQSLRNTLCYEEMNIASKPGQFGWNKLDSGSILLAQQFPKVQINVPTTILDLGCGYGFLSLAAHRQWPSAHITATDNNAAALSSCKLNFNQQSITGEIIAADCATGVIKKHDLVLCNPPFHQGFLVDRELTEKFMAAAKRLCQSTGCALFVVNEFIPLESIAKEYFNQQQLLASDGHFKLFKLSN